MRAKTEIVDGREKVTAGLFPLEVVRFMFGKETAVVEVDTVGRNGISWPRTLTVLTVFFLGKLFSESGVACGDQGVARDMACWNLWTVSPPSAQD